eukprot:COSAG06_NODE_10685_length_1636_cov_17.254755_1_plen_82_part_10
MQRALKLCGAAVRCCGPPAPPRQGRAPLRRYGKADIFLLLFLVILRFGLLVLVVVRGREEEAEEEAQAREAEKEKEEEKDWK